MLCMLLYFELFTVADEKKKMIDGTYGDISFARTI